MNKSHTTIVRKKFHHFSICVIGIRPNSKVRERLWIKGKNKKDKENSKKSSDKGQMRNERSRFIVLLPWFVPMKWPQRSFTTILLKEKVQIHRDEEYRSRFHKKTRRIFQGAIWYTQLKINTHDFHFTFNTVNLFCTSDILVFVLRTTISRTKALCNPFL